MTKLKNCLGKGLSKKLKNRKEGLMNKRKFGIIGEKIAQGFLLNKGYDILETNFYTKIGEIDIIAKIDKCIVFIEVKTRSCLKYGTPAMAVDVTKKQHIKSVAKLYLYLHKLYNQEVRFDVIEIFINDGKFNINHIKGAM